MKKCVLYDRECMECGECNLCDLEPGKLCDNCMRCVESGSDYSEVVIEDIVDGVENALLSSRRRIAENCEKPGKSSGLPGFGKTGKTVDPAGQSSLNLTALAA